MWNRLVFVLALGQTVGHVLQHVSRPIRPLVKQALDQSLVTGAILQRPHQFTRGLGHIPRRLRHQHRNLVVGCEVNRAQVEQGGAHRSVRPHGHGGVTGWQADTPHFQLLVG